MLKVEFFCAGNRVCFWGYGEVPEMPVGDGFGHEVKVVRIMESRWDGWSQVIDEEEIADLERVGMLHRKDGELYAMCFAHELTAFGVAPGPGQAALWELS